MNVPPSDWTIDYFLANESKCMQVLENSDALKAIPCINSASLHNFKDGQLVCFEGMLQDMYDPEFYLKHYQVVDKNTGQISIRNGMYLDGARCEPHEEVLLNTEKNERFQRQTWVVISTPGLNNWVKQEKIKENVLKKNKISDPSSINHNNKRSLNESEEPLDCSEPVIKIRKVSTVESDASSSQSKETTKSTVSKDHILNFPIPCEDGKSCIVKVYKEFYCRLNEIVNIIGFISLDPNLSAIYDSEEMDLERQTHHPPASLVPRLHAVQIIKENTERNNPKPSFISKVLRTRGDLHTLLSQLLFGDKIAADYLICHLISSVYMRGSYLCFGAFALNITNFPQEHENFVKDFYEIFQLIVAKSHLLDITLDNLNTMNFIPKKDYERNRLTSGVLQLSRNTHLVLDETKLSAGELTAFGRQNYKAVSDLIQCQKLPYDFKYYPVEFETDIPVLILSETKSFIPCQIQIPLKPDPDTVRLYPQVIEAAKQFIKEENRLSDIRHYIQTLKNLAFEYTEETAKMIQEDFVVLMRTNEKVTVDNLHSLMVFSRLRASSFGSRKLNVIVWKECLSMETERLRRLPPRRI